MAEDGGGDTFGGFTFASFPSNPPSTTFHSTTIPQSNGANSATDDDEWGDFFEFTLHTPSAASPVQSKPSETFDSVVANGSVDSKSVSPTSWVKPSGALPISLFGDAEEEHEGEDEDDFRRSNFSNNHTRNGSNSKNVGKTVTIDDIFANLYNQTPQIKFENVPGSYSVPKADSSANDLNLDGKSRDLNVENGFYSIPRVDSNASDLVDGKIQDVKVECRFYSSSRLNSASSGFSDGNVEFNGMHSNSEVDGTKSLSDKSQDVKAENGFYSSPRIDLIASDLVDDNSRDVKVENGFYSSSNLNSVSSGFSDWNVNFNTVYSNSEVDVTKSLSNYGQQMKSENDGLNFKSNELDPSPGGSSSCLFSGWTLESNNFSLSAKKLNSNAKSSNLDMIHMTKESDGAPPDNDDDDDEGWEFKDAYSEPTAGDTNNMVDSKVHEVSEKSVSSSGIGNRSIDLFGTANQSIDLFSPSTGVDLFSTSSDFPSSSQDVNFFEIQPNVAAPNNFISDTLSNSERIDIKDGLNPSPSVGYAESDDGFGDFTTAFSETGPMPREALDDDFLSSSEDVVSLPNGTIQEETRSNSCEGALPLSIFGDEEPASDGYLDAQDAFMNQPSSHQRNGHAPSSVISINDLISNLYSQQTSSIETVQKPTEIKLNTSDAISSSDTVNNDDSGFDDNTREFKDAFSQKIVENEASLYSVEDEHLISSSKLKLNNYVDFYSRLKDELCFIAIRHIVSLKSARSTADLSSEYAKVAVLDEEILEACKELGLMNAIFKEDDSLDHPSGESYLNDFIEVLLEPKFLVIESEYHLSEKLLLVEQDLRLAIELMKHTTTMLKILMLGTLEEQQIYVTTWSKMISVCTQELNHGALIWKEAAEKKVQNQIASEPRGREFILALGEIYRVVVVLGASAKLFKPWTLSCWSNIDMLLEECHAVWSSSGLEEAISSVSEQTSFDDDTSFLKSIKYISGLDAFALQTYVFTQQEDSCRLSILTTGAVPGIKMATWGDEHYFVALANLWANLVSCNPPELPELHIA